MEELNNKLSSGNPVVISQIISKLVQNIKGKQDTDILELPEFKFLKDKCISHDNAVNIVAAEGLLQIVRSGNTSLVKSVITDFITFITITKCSINMASLINKLLLIDLKNETSVQNYNKSSFNLRLPQHPFIIMVNEDSSSWSSIYKEIVFSYQTGNESMFPYYDELYKPVFLYILCHPEGNQMLMIKQKLWSFLLQKETLLKNDHFICCLLSWMQFESRDTVQINSDFLIELCDQNRQREILDPNLLLFWQFSLLHQLILNNFDPRSMILSIFISLDHLHELSIFNPVLLILSKCILLCPSTYLEQLLKICKVIVSRADCDIITKNIIKSALLQWITNSSDLISEAVTYASNLFSLLQTGKSNTRLKGFLDFSDYFYKLINTNTEVYFTTQMYISLEKWKSDEDIINFLHKLEKAPSFFLVKMVDFLIGLFLTEFKDVTITVKVFDLISKCVDYNRALASNVLTIILYKLTDVTDSKLHYQLLKAIPKMAVSKTNFQKIASAIQALNKGGSVLKTFSATLMLDLWKIDNRCYDYLEKFLIAPCTSQSDKWEFYVTKAHILKELCALKPELYGKEIVAHLSKILNECNNADGAVASALAMDGITLLCKSEIIDAVTTWATLEPMFKTESRIPVIKSLCLLISEIPTLSYSDAYPKLSEDAVAKLWQYILLNPSDEVWKAALNSLTHFSLEQIVAQTPDEFFDEEILNVRKSGHIVPGHCWIHFLKNCTESKLQIAGDFLIKLISLEVSGYLKFVYQVKGTREPVDYSYLPVNSVVRGISTYIKSRVLKWKGSVYKEVYLQCLRIFSQEYSKPLPPLDWCFLQELFHEQEAKNFCINIAAHQVVLSGTARRFLVNYIEALTQSYTTDQDILHIYYNLKYLANSIQPFTLKPFLEVTICHAVDLFRAGNETLLLDIVKHVKDTLRNDDIQEANKIAIAQIFTDIYYETEVSSKLFEIILECIILFPAKCVDDISSPKSVKEVRPEWFQKAIRVRCTLAINCNNSPLNLLNELMENGSSFPALTPFMFEQFSAVFEKHKDNTECVLWVLELIGQIQAVTAEKFEEKEILFLCNVFILATIVFSGHFVFLEDFSNCEEIYKLFPRAITTLLDMNHWSICTNQALDWFYHMNTEKTFCKEYKDMFVQCLQSLRHETEFNKNMKWTKYLNVEC